MKYRDYGHWSEIDVAWPFYDDPTVTNQQQIDKQNNYTGMNQLVCMQKPSIFHCSQLSTLRAQRLSGGRKNTSK